VPEKRQELTTEGGLDVLAAGPFLAEAVRRLAAKGTEVSIFIEADPHQIEAAARLGAQAIELHTGAYADATPGERPAHLRRLRAGAAAAAALGLRCHAGHGLSYETVGPIAAMPQVIEVSIGHFLISRSVFEGLPAVVRRFKALIAEARP
jgi:pyridoxine 5-phosphate synthase